MKQKVTTAMVVERSGVEDSRIDRGVSKMDVDGKTNDAHGGEEQRVTITISQQLFVSATHLRWPKFMIWCVVLGG